MNQKLFGACTQPPFPKNPGRLTFRAFGLFDAEEGETFNSPLSVIEPLFFFKVKADRLIKAGIIHPIRLHFYVEKKMDWPF